MYRSRPYKKRSFKKSYSQKRIPFYKTPYPRPEIKQFALTNATAVGTYNYNYCLANPVDIPINAIIQGTGYNERIGTKIKITSIQINVFIEVTVATQDVCRVVVVWDDQANQVAPNFQGCFINSIAATEAYQDPQTRKRYQILYDKKNAVIAASPKSLWNINKYIKVGKEAMYRGINSPNSYGMNATGSITLWLISNKVGSEFRVGWNTKINYYDC